MKQAKIEAMKLDVKENFVISKEGHIENCIYAGISYEALDKLEIIIQVEGDVINFDLKDLLSKQLFSHITFTDVEISQIARAFNVQITFYPNGRSSCEKMWNKNNPDSSLYLGIVSSPVNNKYLLGIYYFEKQPGLFFAIIDKIYQLS